MGCNYDVFQPGCKLTNQCYTICGILPACLGRLSKNSLPVPVG